ncbi:MAG: tryptophan--tRNA ligase [Candidatus Hatepunaea meridiana]|nr:tryptophan--tRNA ligase [Candidatus Hatepunaea meridiana]
MKKRVLSGIQPTGNIHIGNYLGAMQHWVASQDEYDNFFCIVDLHSITVPQDVKQLRAKVRELAGILLAIGIDPEKSTIFVQSNISAHAELTWILNCFTPIGWLQRMTQFKDKSEKQEVISTGLFDYPVLMTADILLYNADYVPVGEDQKQHVELSRDIAIRFNSIYGKVFKIPEALIPKVGARIMGLDDPTRKMSKSEAGQGHAINLLDPPNVITNKIKRAATDSQRDILFDKNRPGVYNLLTIYELFSKMSRPKIESHFSGKGYSDLKKELAEVVIEGLRPIQERYKEITSDPSYIETLLKSGADKARPFAESVLNKVMDKVGLG